MKNILIVDDKIDTGATFEWLMHDWKESCLSESPCGIIYLETM